MQGDVESCGFVLKELAKSHSANRIRLNLALVHAAKSSQLFFPKSDTQPRVMFIFGCQRSGTSIMNRVLAADWNTYVFRERSRLTSDDEVERLRLNDSSKARGTISRFRQDLVTAKLLVESQRMVDVLDDFPSSCGLWMFRDYRDAASSSLSKFGTSVGLDDLRPIVEGQPSNWRSENVPPERRETVVRLYNSGLSPVEAAAVFWWVRNQIVLDTELPEPERVALLRYQDFAKDPISTMRDLYGWLGVPYPGDRVVSDVHPYSVKKGQSVELRPEIRSLCDDTMDALVELAAKMPCSPDRSPWKR